MTNIPSLLDACPCEFFPWLAKLVLSLFATIDDEVVEE